MEKPITADEMRRTSWESMLRLEDLFRKLFPSVTAFKNANAHFTPQVLLTLLQNRGGEVTAVDVEELRSLTATMGKLRDSIYSVATARTDLEQGKAKEIAAHLQECSTRLDRLYAKI